MLRIDDLWRFSGGHDVIRLLVIEHSALYDVNVIASCVMGVWASPKRYTHSISAYMYITG